MPDVYSNIASLDAAMPEHARVLEIECREIR
jgi:hypothetical protein